jgi:hypothetical protein
MLIPSGPSFEVQLRSEISYRVFYIAQYYVPFYNKCYKEPEVCSTS